MELLSLQFQKIHNHLVNINRTPTTPVLYFIVDLDFFYFLLFYHFFFYFFFFSFFFFQYIFIIFFYLLLIINYIYYNYCGSTYNYSRLFKLVEFYIWYLTKYILSFHF